MAGLQPSFKIGECVKLVRVDGLPPHAQEMRLADFLVTDVSLDDNWLKLDHPEMKGLWSQARFERVEDTLGAATDRLNNTFNEVLQQVLRVRYDLATDRYEDLDAPGVFFSGEDLQKAMAARIVVSDRVAHFPNGTVMAEEVYEDLKRHPMIAPRLTFDLSDEALEKAARDWANGPIMSEPQAYVAIRIKAGDEVPCPECWTTGGEHQAGCAFTEIDTEGDEDLSSDECAAIAKTAIQQLEYGTTFQLTGRASTWVGEDGVKRELPEYVRRPFFADAFRAAADRARESIRSSVGGLIASISTKPKPTRFITAEDEGVHRAISAFGAACANRRANDL